MLLAAAAALVWIGYFVAASSPEDHRALPLFGLKYPRDRTFLLWLSVGLSGIAGGASFDLKWLYHSVAKWTWNSDRVLWRLIVPILSGTLATASAMMVASGVVSFLNAQFFNNFYGAVGAGYFIGYFSDNVLAALQNLAVRWFGTVDKKYTGRVEQNGSEPEDDANGAAGE